MCGFCNVWVCLYVGFVMCSCVYVWVCNVLLCVCVGLKCVCVCVFVGFVMCGCV